jgi:hypothetical protein
MDRLHARKQSNRSHDSHFSHESQEKRQGSPLQGHESKKKGTLPNEAIFNMGSFASEKLGKIAATS